MKNLVVYYSMSGNCEYVAEKMAEIGGFETLRIEPEKAYPDQGAKKFLWGGKAAVMGEKPKLKPYTFDASEYDVIVIGFPVWASNVTPPIRSFLLENMEGIRNKRIASFACQSGNGAEKAFRKLKKLLGREELDAELILIDPKKIDSSQDTGMIREFCKRLTAG